MKIHEYQAKQLIEAVWRARPRRAGRLQPG